MYVSSLEIKPSQFTVRMTVMITQKPLQAHTSGQSDELSKTWLLHHTLHHTLANLLFCWTSQYFKLIHTLPIMLIQIYFQLLSSQVHKVLPQCVLKFKYWYLTPSLIRICLNKYYIYIYIYKYIYTCTHTHTHTYIKIYYKWQLF